MISAVNRQTAQIYRNSDEHNITIYGKSYNKYKHYHSYYYNGGWVEKDRQIDGWMDRQMNEWKNKLLDVDEEGMDG